MADVLLLNIGNTYTEVAVFSGEELVECRLFPSQQIMTPDGAGTLLASHPGMPVLAASVAPAAHQALAQAGRGRVLHFLSPELVDDVDFSSVDTSTLGADRVANAAAALTLADPPVIVLDCGTAITTEVIDVEGSFRGGCIAPGRQLQRTALHAGTGQLPELPLQDELPPAIGADTVAALTAGIDLGIVGAVEKLLVVTCQELQLEEAVVLATGGDAAFFIHHIPGLHDAGEHFTLAGLARVAVRSGLADGS